MKLILNAIVAGLFLLPATGIAQKDSVKPMFNPQSKRNYDPNSVTMISGEITAVNEIAHNQGKSGGIHLEVKSSTGMQIVHVGPKWFVDKQALKLKTGDKIEVTGSQITDDGAAYIIARMIKKGAQTMILRDENGTPAWSGKGKNK